MVVLVLERVPPGVRGQLTRWLLEVRTGVFVGQPSAMVRDRLWTMVCDRVGKVKARANGGAALLLWSSDNEQGYVFRYFGEPSRRVRDFDGLYLVEIPESVPGRG